MRINKTSSGIKGLGAILGLATIIGCSSTRPAIIDDNGNPVPVKTRNVGGYEINIGEITETRYKKHSDESADVSIETRMYGPGSYLYKNLCVIVNGAVAKRDTLLGVERMETHTFPEARDLDNEKLFIESGFKGFMRNHSAVVIDRNPLAGEIVKGVYDRNENGELTQREIERGNKRLDNILKLLTERYVPPTGKYCIIHPVESIDEFRQLLYQAEHNK